jgi:ERCC4-related helicase
MDLSESLAPGSRVRVRGEEWAVERCLPIATGGYAVHVQGLSELVRAHRAIFLTTLDDVESLRPEDTRLVTDESPEYRQTRLYLETLLRRTPPTDSKIHVGHRAAIEVMDYQLAPARRALGEPLEDGTRSIRPRILIADGTGLGKTIEVGILLSELIKRGKGRRILVVAIKSLLAQFQRDLWARFTIPLVRLDSEGIRRVHSKIPSNKNPFSYYDRCIISVDTLKNNGRYRAELEEIRWDAIVVDECQNVANRGSQRETLARLLAAQCDSLILTSATPHNGKPESFANLMRMLDPTAIADEKSFTREDIEHLYVRRFKKDVEDQAGGAFQQREVVSHAARPTPAESAALAALHASDLRSLGRKRGGVDPLFRWTLIKAFLSSPQACLESIDNRIKTTRKATDVDEAGAHPFEKELRTDLDKLAELRALVEAAAPGGSFSKLEALFEQLEAIGFDGTDRSPRVVIFSERIRTLELLREALTRRFKVKKPDEVIETFEASKSDIELQRLKESFGRAESPIRVLLASDAASEGVNLHYHCHQLFHFDIPWSLIRLTQRNGRIDRYGQRQTPWLHYMLTRSEEQTADKQVVDRLIDREKVVYKQLGDAGALLGLYDADAEDDYVTRKIAEGRPVEEVIPDQPRRAPAEPTLRVSDRQAPGQASGDEASFDDAQLDLLELLGSGETTPGQASAQAGAAAGDEADNATEGSVDLLELLDSVPKPSVESVGVATAGLPSLFEGDYPFALTALRQLEHHPLAGPDGIDWESDDAAEALTLYAPASFRKFRAEFLPIEALPAENEPFRLVASHAVVKEKIREALESDDGTWPAWHLLWEQHPLMEWLLDTLGAAYARHEAPLLIAPKLGKQSALFLFATLVSNEEAQPVHTAWFSISESGKKLSSDVLSLDETLARTGLGRGLSNPHEDSERRAELQDLVPGAVAAAREQVASVREPALNELRKQVRRETRRLERWHQGVEAVLAAKEARYRGHADKVPAHLEKKLAQERAGLARIWESHAEWLKGLAAHGAPYVRLAAVFSGS